MITAEKARIETNKYIKIPFNFDLYEMNKFIGSYKHDLNNLDISILESAKKQEFKLIYSIYFNDFDNKLYHPPISKTNQFLYHLFDKKKIHILVKYLNKIGYKSFFNVINKKRMFSKDIFLGFTFEINWKE